MKRLFSQLAIAALAASMLMSCQSSGAQSGSGAVSDPSASGSAASSAPALYESGAWVDGVYRNEFLGFSFKLPNKWSAVSEEELLSRMDLAEDLLSDEQKLAAELVKKQMIYVMSATEPVNNGTLLVLALNLSLSPGGSAFTEEMYLDQVEEQLKATKLKYVLDARGEREIGGETYRALTAAIEGTNVRQRYYVRKKGDYLVTFICSHSKDQAAQFDAALDAIEAL